MGADCEPGDRVTLEYTAQASLNRERRSFEDLRVEEVMSNVVYFESPYGHTDDITLVLDPEGDLWARDEDGRDGYFGSNAEVVEP